MKELAKNRKPVKEADPEEHAEDLQSLFAEVNNLPADDPLRNPVTQGPAPVDAAPVPDAQPTCNPRRSRKSTDARSGPGESSTPAAGPAQTTGSVKVANQRIAVPSFAGKSLRDVVEQANNAGLGVQIVGSGSRAIRLRRQERWFPPEPRSSCVLRNDGAGAQTSRVVKRRLQSA